MATLLVLVEASPYGIHPASALSLCVARDLASERGATVVATLAPKDPSRDAQVLEEVTRRGADRMVFCSGEQLAEFLPSMAPRAILGPASEAGKDQLQALTGQDLTIAWVQGPVESPDAIEGPIALMAGTLPWHELQAELIPEYPGDDQLCDLREMQPARRPEARCPLRFVIDPALDNAQIRAELSLLGATEAVAQESSRDSCICIYIGPDLPETVQPLQRSILIPGDLDRPIQGDWGRADWVLPGTPYDALRGLHSQFWAPYLR